MLKFEFDREQDTPLITAKLFGPNGTRRVQLVFDTGAAKTQFHTPVLESIGYSARHGTQQLVTSGAAGPPQDGYAVILTRINVLGNKFREVEVGVFDFENLIEGGIDGLLGFDLIREFHLELKGRAGELIVFPESEGEKPN